MSETKNEFGFHNLVYCNTNTRHPGIPVFGDIDLQEGVSSYVVSEFTKDCT